MMGDDKVYTTRGSGHSREGPGVYPGSVYTDLVAIVTKPEAFPTGIRPTSGPEARSGPEAILRNIG